MLGKAAIQVRCDTDIGFQGASVGRDKEITVPGWCYYLFDLCRHLQ
jgi:hypothetical protein